MKRKSKKVPIKRGKNGGVRPGAGRKEKEISLAALEQLCRLNVTDQEIAAHFKVSPGAVTQRKERDPEFAAIIERGKANGKISLRRSLIRLAQRDGRTAIHLSKNILGYSDKIEVQDNKNIQVNHTVTVEVGKALSQYLSELRELRRGVNPQPRTLVLGRTGS